MLDLAHSVFNVVTGVSLNDERNEIRGFRSVQQWREIIEAAGFVDTMLSEVQFDDPTKDEMLCFYKPPFTIYPPRTDITPPPMLGSDASTPFMPGIARVTKTLPSMALSLIRSIIEGFISKLPVIGTSLVEYTKSFASAGVANVIQQVVDRSMGELTQWLERFRPFLDSSDTNVEVPSEMIPPELFLIIPALNRKVAKGSASPMEMIASALIQDIQRAFMGQADETPAEKEKAEQAKKRRHNVSFNREMVLQKIDEIQTALPVLREKRILDDLELPQLARSALKSYWAAHKSASDFDKVSRGTAPSSSSSSSTSPSSSSTSSSQGKKYDHSLWPLADAFVDYLDNASWNALSAAADEIIQTKTKPPSIFAMIQAAATENGTVGSTAEAMWGRLLQAILSAPTIYINRKMLFQV